VGYLDDRVDQLQDGLDDAVPGDEIDRTNRLLAIIAAELTDQPAGYYQDGFEPTAPGEVDDGRQTAQYSSVEAITASTDAEVEDWGFQADTVVIRNIDDELAVAFKDPSRHDDATITVRPQDDAFVLSGVYGISTKRIWYQQGAGAAGEHSFDLLAVKKRGRN